MPMLLAPRRHPTERPPHTLGGRPAENLEPPRPTLPTDVSQPKEVEGRRLLVPPGCTVRGEAPNSMSRVFASFSRSPNFPQDRAVVTVGVTHDTAEFAVENIRRWWRLMGKRSYPAAHRLLV
jgi:hypothetical protein